MTETNECAILETKKIDKGLRIICFVLVVALLIMLVGSYDALDQKRRKCYESHLGEIQKVDVWWLSNRTEEKKTFLRNLTIPKELNAYVWNANNFGLMEIRGNLFSDLSDMGTLNFFEEIPCDIHDLWNLSRKEAIKMELIRR